MPHTLALTSLKEPLTIKTLLTYLVVYLATAEAVSQSIGARAIGMGNTASCLSDVWALHNNIAGLAEIEQPIVAASYHSIPNFRHFDRMSAVFAQTIAGGAGAVGVLRFGDDLYNEHFVSLGYSNTFGLASIGFKANYLQYRAKGRPTRGAITFSFGGIATLTPHFLFGAHITNLNQPVLNVVTGERVPTRLTAGVAFRPSENLIVSLEIDKDIHHSPATHAGFEYRASPSAAIRTGFNFQPQCGFAGVGLSLGRLQVDYAVQIDYAFGLSHYATTAWQFDQK